MIITVIVLIITTRLSLIVTDYHDTIITVIVLIILLKVQRDGGELDGCAHHRRPWLRRVGPALLDDPPGF